MTNDNTMTTK